MGDARRARDGADESLAAAGFMKVARTRDVPEGGMRRVEVGTQLICLAKVSGQIYAISDDCPHIGGGLSDGELAGCIVTCPVHLAQFDVRSGRVLRGPAREDVPAYAVRIVGDDVYVSLRQQRRSQTDEKTNENEA